MQDNVESFLNAMDLFILPSHFEGLPLSLIESQANGLPTLVSDVVSDEVCLTETIRKFSLNASAKAWANKLASLHALGRFNSTGQISQLRSKGYDISRQSQSLMKLYLSSS